MRTLAELLRDVDARGITLVADGETLRMSDDSTVPGRTHRSRVQNDGDRVVRTLAELLRDVDARGITRAARGETLRMSDDSTVRALAGRIDLACGTTEIEL